MRNQLSAEWIKLRPHRATWFLVWLYPIAFLLILAIGVVVALVNPDPVKPTSVAEWIDQTAMIWNVPRTAFGRYLIAAYFALVFAGEYGWNTWKLIVPHSARWKLIAAKYLVPLALLYIAWIATGAICVAMDLLKAGLTEQVVPAGVTAGGILRWHWLMLVGGIVPVLLTATYASVMAVLTRSTLAAFIISIVLITMDQIFGKLVQMLSRYGMEWLTLLYRVLPGYHLENLASWWLEGAGFQMKFAGGTVVACSMAMSLLVLTAWIAALAALTLVTFRRQDIN
jgi:ABC-2 type transport system permease protein